jgi:Zn finger protein HypA/HybF involved in hydrogenase expression
VPKYTKFIYKTRISIYKFNKLIFWRKKMAEGRCMKCKKQVEIKDAQEVVMKNGMKAVKGICPHCGTKVFRILGKA